MMAKPRQIPRLDSLAFEALIRHRMEITPNSAAEYDVLMHHKHKREIPIFLQAIADGNQAEVEDMLNDNPRLIEIASGTVTTLSLDTIENVTAIQLAYLVEDEKIGKVLADAVDQLNNPAIKEKVSQELEIKISEVKEQEAQFKKFDFTDLACAITNDIKLKTKGMAGPETKKAFADFKDYFQPKVVSKARPFNMKDLKECYEVYDKNFNAWELKQLMWFLRNVVRLLLGRVTASYGQAFSNGLYNPFHRSFKLKNYVNKCDLSYYSSCHSHDVPDNFFIDIYYGKGWAWFPGDARNKHARLTNYMDQKQKDWKQVDEQLRSQDQQNQCELKTQNNSVSVFPHQ